MNNQAPELSPEARRLINEARGADDPTAEDQARVKARWLASVAAVAGVSSLTEAARAAGGIGWGLKAAGAALVIAAGAIGLNFALDSGSAPERGSPLPGLEGSSHERFEKTPSARERRVEVPQPPVAAAPVPAVAPAPAPGSAAAEPAELNQPLVAEAEAGAEEVVATPPSHTAADSAASVAARQDTVKQGPAAVRSASAGPRARAVSRAGAARPSAPKGDEKELVVAAPAAAAPSGQLGEELALLSEVRSSIQDGRGTRALELLDRYEARFGQPILGMEADALRVDALCKSGQRDAARESARAFQNEWPGSPLERRVSAACP